MANKIQLRRDTSANWTRVNPVLDDGEPGLEIDTNKVKYGDGNTAWNSLDYASGGLTDVDGVVTFPGDLLIGTLWPEGDDKESVVWAKDDTEYLGLWWGGDQIYPEPYYGPVAGIMIGAYDLMTDDFTDNASPVGTTITMGINDSNGDTLTWVFDRAGILTLPFGSTINDTASAPGTGNGQAVEIKPGGANNVNQLLRIYPTVLNPDGNHLHLTSGNLSVTDLFLGDDNQFVQIAADGNVCIGTNGNSVNIWQFDTDGTLTLPPSGDILIDGGINSAIRDLIQHDVHTGAADYTLALSDRGKMIYQTGGYSVFVPTSNTFPVGSVITIVNSGGAGDLFIDAADSGTNTDIYGAGTDTNSNTWALPSNSIASLMKVEASGAYSKWLLSGVGIYDNS